MGFKHIHLISQNSGKNFKKISGAFLFSLSVVFRMLKQFHYKKLLKITGSIYAAAMVIWPYYVGYYFQSKTSTPIPCPDDRNDIVPLRVVMVKYWQWFCVFFYTVRFKNIKEMIPEIIVPNLEGFTVSKCNWVLLRCWSVPQKHVFNNNNNNNMWTYIAHVSGAQGALLPLLIRLTRLINHSWNHLSSLGSIQLNCCHYSAYTCTHVGLINQLCPHRYPFNPWVERSNYD